MSVPARRALRRAGLLCALALALAFACLTPRAARADFTAQMCNGRTAAPWVNGPAPDNPFVGIQDTCSSPGGVEIFFISGQRTMPQQTNDSARVLAPPGERFTHVAAAFHSDADTSPSTSFTSLTWGYDSTYLTQAASGDSSAGTSLSANLPDASSVFIRLFCFGTQPCTFADNQVVRIGEFDLTVHDTGAPSVHPLGGSLASPGTYGGTQTLGFSASDTGSGVDHVTVSLGSTVAGTFTVSCQSASLTPCPANASGVVDVNTKAVADGTYPVILTAFDASGDPSPSQVGTVRIRNHTGSLSLPRPRRGVRAKVMISWEWTATRTTLTRITLAHVPRDGRVALACRGRRCPIGRLGADRRGLRALARRLRGRVFRPGQRLLLTVSAPGRRSERAQIIIRADAIPRVRGG